MRITDNNISELIMDRNAVHMEYVGCELLRFACYSQMLYNFELITSFFGDDSEKLAQLLNEHPSHLLIRDDDYHPMTDINCTLFDIKSADYTNGKIKLSLTGFRYSKCPQNAEKDAKTISGKRFKFIESQLSNSMIYDLVMVKVN
jgi:hypothetical protein